MSDRLLTQTQVAQLLNVRPRTLESWRQRRFGPPFLIYSARCIRYREQALLAWLASREIGAIAADHDTLPRDLLQGHEAQAMVTRKDGRR
jgi:Helix-turn-helix domain